MLVEHEQSLEDLESVLVGGLLPDLQVELLVRQGLFRLESLEGQGRGKVGCLVGSGVCKVRQTVETRQEWRQYSQWVMAKLM